MAYNIQKINAKYAIFYEYIYNIYNYMRWLINHVIIKCTITSKLNII